MKSISKKIWMIGGAVAVVAVVAIIIAVVSGGKKDTYRSVMVYDITGEAVISREGAGDIDAYENLMLQSGDRLSVGRDSSVRLKLDGDKYVMAEQDTVLTIVADGNSEDSKTYIDLQKGAITNEIQNQLSGNSTYEVTTPNSVMAVRGTVFRVSVEVDANGETHTQVYTFEGTVGSFLVKPDGTVAEEEVKIESGKVVVIYGNDQDSVYVTEPEDIDFTKLPIEGLENLRDILVEGGSLCITIEEIDDLLGGGT